MFSCTLSHHADGQRRAALREHERIWKPLQLLRPCTLHRGQTPVLTDFPPVHTKETGDEIVVLFFEDTQISRLPPYALARIGRRGIALARNLGLHTDCLNYTLQACSPARARPLIACTRVAGPHAIRHPFLSVDLARLLRSASPRAGNEALQFFRLQNERDCLFSLQRFLRDKGVTPGDLPPKDSARWRVITGLEGGDCTFTYLLLRDQVWRVSWQLQKQPVPLKTFLSWLPEAFARVQRLLSPKALRPLGLEDDVQLMLSFDLSLCDEAS